MKPESGFLSRLPCLERIMRQNGHITLYWKQTWVWIRQAGGIARMWKHAKNSMTQCGKSFAIVGRGSKSKIHHCGRIQKRHGNRPRLSTWARSQQLLHIQIYWFIAQIVWFHWIIYMGTSRCLGSCLCRKFYGGFFLGKLSGHGQESVQADEMPESPR